MYSREWFETYAATVPAATTAADVRGVTTALAADRYPRILDVGCGIGRVAGPLSMLGYSVTGLDVNIEALLTANQRARGPRNDIQCDIYRPEEIRDLSRRAGLEPGVEMVWRSAGTPPGPDSPRYQVICMRPE